MLSSNFSFFLQGLIKSCLLLLLLIIYFENLRLFFSFIFSQTLSSGLAFTSTQLPCIFSLKSVFFFFSGYPRIRTYNNDFSLAKVFRVDPRNLYKNNKEMRYNIEGSLKGLLLRKLSL